MKAHELFKLLDPAIVAELFTTFREEEREIYKSAVASLAQARKLRPVYVSVLVSFIFAIMVSNTTLGHMALLLKKWHDQGRYL